MPTAYAAKTIRTKKKTKIIKKISMFEENGNLVIQFDEPIALDNYQLRVRIGEDTGSSKAPQREVFR